MKAVPAAAPSRMETPGRPRRIRAPSTARRVCGSRVIIPSTYAQAQLKQMRPGVKSPARRLARNVGRAQPCHLR